MIAPPRDLIEQSGAEHPPGEFAAFLPADRRGQEPVKSPSKGAHGVVLLADLVGFTARSEALTSMLGPRRAAESMASLLHTTYEAILRPVDAGRGCAVTFIGDAILCWFEPWGDEPFERAGQRALAAAVAIPGALARTSADTDAAGLPPLQVRVLVAAGAAWRFLVGDPSDRVMDVLAGPPVRRVGALLAVAAPGEVVADVHTPGLNGANTTPVEAAGCVLVQGLKAPSAKAPAWLTNPVVSQEALRPWLPPAVYQRVVQGEGAFVSDLRLAATLFVLVDGFSSEAADAGTMIDQWVRQTQSMLVRWGGTLVDVTESDRGLSLYAVFGALDAFDDTPARAVGAALELCAAAWPGPGQRVRTGLGYGDLRVGIIGSHVRRTWAVTGRETNLAARLAEAAPTGGVLVSERLGRSLTGVQSVTLQGVAGFSMKGIGTDTRCFLATLTPLESRVPSTRAHQANPTLVGREHELAQAEDLLRESAGRVVPVVVRVVGEPGVGKSVFVAEWVDRARRRGFRVLHAAADPIERWTPLSTWQQILPALDELRVVIEALAPDDIDLLPLVASVTGVPAQGTVRSDAIAPESRADVIRSLVVHAMERDVSDAPRLLWVDDAQWLDSASWTILRLLTMRARRMLVVLCQRANPPSDGVVRDLDPETDVRTMTLGPLSMADLAEILNRSTGADSVEDDVVQTMVSRTGAHPLFAATAARGLLERGSLEIVQGTLRFTHAVGITSVMDVPDSLEQAITARLDHLGPERRLAVKVASVLGAGFDARAVHAIHPMKPSLDDIATGIQHLISQGIFRNVDNGQTFAHETLREVAYAHLDAPQRLGLHRAAAQFLQTQQGATLATLAFHWRRAGASEQALHYLDAAGQFALEKGAYVEALEHLQAARSLASPDEGPRNHARLAEVSRAQYRAGQLNEAVETAQVLLAALDRPVPETRSMLVRSLVEIGRQTLHRMVGTHRQRWPSDRDRAVAAAAAAQYAYYGELCFFTRRYEALMYSSLRGLNVAESIPATEALVVSYGNAMIAAGTFGLVGLGRRYAALAADVGRTRPLADWTRAMLIHQRNLFYLGTGDLKDVLRDQPEAVALFTRCGDRGRVRDAWVIHVSALVLSGQWTGAVAVAARLTRPDGTDERYAQQTYGWMYVAAIACRRGRWDEARRALESLDRSQRMTAIDSTVAAFDGLGAAEAMARGDAVTARQRLDGLFARLARTRGVPLGVPDVEAYVGASLASVGLLQAAADRRDRDAHRKALQIALRVGRLIAIGARFLPVVTGLRHLHDAACARLAGRHAQALRSCRDGLTSAVAMGTAWEAARLNAFEDLSSGTTPQDSVLSANRADPQVRGTGHLPPDAVETGASP